MSSGNSSLDGAPGETLSRSYSVSTADRVREPPSRDYDGLKSQCEKAQHELQVLRRQHSETVRRCDHTMKELEYYRGQHHAAMAQLESAAQESSSLRTKYGELVSDLRSSQEGENGNGDPLNQLYMTTLTKYETIKEEYESLRKRYDDLIASHSSAVDKLELAQEEVGRIKKQCEEMVSERNVAVRERNGLKQQCTAAIRQWDIALRERNEYQEALVKVQQQHEEAVKEINQAMAVKMKASKDLKRLTDERNAAMQEYSLIMSERDTVHKEMEKLTEDLAQAKKKNKAIEAEAKQMAEEKKALTYQVETLKREIASALHDRDKALKEVNDLRQRGGEFKDRNQFEGAKTRYDSSYRERDPGRKDMRESQSSSMDLFSKCQKERMDNLDQANLEIEKLNKQVDKLQSELQETLQEAEVSKRRRDWAFSERDKIVMERESIRTLCDRLRKERDRAVSDLAEALRDSDDINKQRAETNKQLKVLKEKMELQLEKENRMVQLHSSVGHNYSHDSAIDTDMQEYDSEILSIDINGLSSTEDLGVELAGGRDDPHYPNDTGIYVTSIMKGSVADGKLRPNDCIVRVNNVDCTNASKRFVLETMKSSGNTAVMVVRRRRLYSTQLQLNKYEHGLILEAGIYISKILQGSRAAKDGNLAVGDRVVSINNKTVEGVMSAREAMALLNETADVLHIMTLKSFASPVIVSRQSAATQTLFPSPREVLSSSEDNEPELPPPPPKSRNKWRDSSEEKKRNRNSSPLTFEQETDDALAELDSVIDTYHAKGTVRRRPKHSDRNGGTWPKARVGPLIEPGTGTIVHPKKNKERLPLSVIMNNSPHTQEAQVIILSTHSTMLVLHLPVVLPC
uniref:PDZ domain-containing protein n=1 Tax=Lygus hesperus TaxID=30085 RepID=A0A0A9XJ47_LYGHE